MVNGLDLSIHPSKNIKKDFDLLKKENQNQKGGGQHCCRC